MAQATPISDSEWDVMEPIWEAGACTAAEVIKRLRADARLEPQHDSHAAGAAGRERRRSSTRSTDRGTSTGPAVSRRQCVRQKGRSFLEKSLRRRRRGPAWCTLSTEASLDKDQIEQLLQMLEQKKKPREKRNDRTARIGRRGDLAGFLAGGSAGTAGHLAGAGVWRTDSSRGGVTGSSESSFSGC